MQQHAYHANVHADRDCLRAAGRVIEYAGGEFVVYWGRYMVAAKLRCKLRAWVKLGKTRGPQAGVEKATRTR